MTKQEFLDKVNNKYKEHQENQFGYINPKIRSNEVKALSEVLWDIQEETDKELQAIHEELIKLWDSSKQDHNPVKMDPRAYYNHAGSTFNN